MPGRIWYWVAGAVFLAGMAGAALFLVPKLSGIGDRFTRVVVPGSAELALAEPGWYTIFHEARSVVDGTLYQVEDISGLSVSVAALPGLQPVALSEPATSGSYDIGGHAGVSVLAFEVEHPGRFRLTAAYADGRAEPRTVLAVGQGFVGELLRAIFGTVGIGFASIGAAVAIWVVTLLKRRNALRAAGRA